MQIIRRKRRGFTLVELMIVVAIIGVLAALAIYGVRKYLLNAKTAEARNAIGRMAKDASSAYNREQMSAAVLALGGTAAAANALCTTAAAAVPNDQTLIAGRKYQSQPSDWSAGSQASGWQCLKFSMQEPQYYMYSYTSADANNFTAQAQGDLDGDTTLSTFSLLGQVQNTSSGSTVLIAPTIGETNPEE